jgi:uncharacterized protein with gpF-like domain
MTWRQYARLLLKIEQRYQPKILKAIRAYYKQVIEDIEADGIHAAKNRMNQHAMNEALLPVINDLYKKVGVWGAKLQFQELQQKAKAKQKAGGFGRNAEWITQVIAYLGRHALAFLQDITDTTRNDILKILQRGIDESLSISEIVRELRTTGLTDTRARVITRTETVRAANVGHRIGARSFPFEVNKKWIAATDHRTRHSHRLINGHVVDEEGYFEVAVYENGKPTGKIDQMNAPGDPEASAANTINCRCRVIFEPKEDAQGNLIRREANQAPVIPMRRPQQIPVEQIAAQLKNNIYMGVE